MNTITILLLAVIGMIAVCAGLKDKGYRRGAMAAVVLGNAAGQLLYFYVIYFRNAATIVLSIGLSSVLLVLLYLCITVAQQYMKTKAGSKKTAADKWEAKKQELPNEDEKLMKLADIVAMAQRQPQADALPPQEKLDETQQDPVLWPAEELQQELKAVAAIDGQQNEVKKTVLGLPVKEKDSAKTNEIKILQEIVKEGQKEEATKKIFQILNAGYDLDEGERHKLNVLLLALREERK